MVMRSTLPLLFIFLIVLGTRLVLSGSTPYLFGDESYFVMREVDHLRQEGTPLRYDPLSERQRAHSPLFSYILSFFTYFLPPIAVYKIIPNLFATSFVLIAYLIAHTITRDTHTSLLTSAFAGFTPIFIAETYNHVSVYTLVIPLFGLLIYSFLHIDTPRGVKLYLVTLTFFTLLHPTVFIFVLGLLLYTLVLSIENVPLAPREKEIILYTVLFTLFVELILARDVFLKHSSSIIWQNIPQGIFSLYFKDFSILEAIYKIDAVPFLFGLYAIRYYLFKVPNKLMYFLISIALTIGALLVFKLIPIHVGLLLLGMIMVLLFAKSYQYRLRLVARSRASRFLQLWKAVLFVSFLSTAVLASIYLALAEPQRRTIEEEQQALAWLTEHSGNRSMILSDIVDSQKIMAVAHRRTVLDSDFLLVPHSDLLYEDIATVFTSPYITQVGERLEQYHVEYVYLSQAARGIYGVPVLPSSNPRCLPLVYNHTVQIYQWKCKLEELT